MISNLFYIEKVEKSFSAKNKREKESFIDARRFLSRSLLTHTQQCIYNVRQKTNIFLFITTFSYKNIINEQKQVNEFYLITRNTTEFYQSFCFFFEN
jgi:hypothetical protein